MFLSIVAFGQKKYKFNKVLVNNNNWSLISDSKHIVNGVVIDKHKIKTEPLFSKYRRGKRLFYIKNGKETKSVITIGKQVIWIQHRDDDYNLNGVFNEWFRDGSVRRISNYKNGRIVGSYKEFYGGSNVNINANSSNNELRCELYCDTNGTPIGVHKLHYPSGKIKIKATFYNSTKYLQKKGVEAKKGGIETKEEIVSYLLSPFDNYTKGGYKKTKQLWLLKTQKIWNENGKLISDENYEKGYIKKYHENGQLSVFEKVNEQYIPKVSDDKEPISLGIEDGVYFWGLKTISKECFNKDGNPIKCD